MKRWNHSSSTLNDNTDFLEIEVDIIFTAAAVEGSSILDINDSEFFDFEGSLLDILDMHDFNLEDSYQSSQKDSISQYYILTKLNEDKTRLRVFVKLRVSDHAVPNRTYRGREISHEKIDDGYTKREAKKFAIDRYNQERGYHPRRLDIIFDDAHYTSYEQALRAIESKLDEFDPE